MNKKLIIGSVAGMAVVGVLAFVPMSVNALTAHNQIRTGAGYDGANGSGNGLVIKAKAMDIITSDRYHEKVQTLAREQWKAMGLSDEQIQQRIQDQKQRQANCDGTGQHLGQGGYHNGQNR